MEGLSEEKIKANKNVKERYGKRIILEYDKEGKIDFNLNEEDLEGIVFCNRAIVIQKNESLDINKIDQIADVVKQGNVLIRLQSDEIYSAEELKILKENIAKVKDKNINIEFEEGFTIEQAECASSRIDKWARETNAARVDGTELSPFEKYMRAYLIVTNFLYNLEEENEQSSLSRNINHVLGNNDKKVNKICCVGFASMLKCLCDKVGVECECIDVNTEVENGEYYTETPDHEMCIVKIDDDKYNIHGSYYSDPTNDCQRIIGEKRIWQSINYASILPLDLDHLYGRDKKVLPAFDSGIPLMPEQERVNYDKRIKCLYNIMKDQNKEDFDEDASDIVGGILISTSINMDADSSALTEDDLVFNMAAEGKLLYRGQKEEDRFKNLIKYYGYFGKKYDGHIKFMLEYNKTFGIIKSPEISTLPTMGEGFYKETNFFLKSDAGRSNG